MKKLIVIIGFSFLLPLLVKSQQILLYNQFNLDPYSINPAAIGFDHQLHINLCYRQQWLGFNQSPGSYYFNIHSQLGNKPAVSYKPMSLRISQPNKYNTLNPASNKKFKHAMGGMVQNHQDGAFSRLSTSLSYALHYKLNEKYTLSTGIETGLLTCRINDEGLTLIDPDDQTFDQFVSQNFSSSLLNLNAGLWLYSENVSFGYSARQIIKNQIWHINNSSVVQLKVHHYLSATYKKALNEKINIKAGLLFRYLKDTRPAIDLNLLAEFKDSYWGGIGYRVNNALILQAGLRFGEFSFGYSFDYNTTALSAYNSGSHELLVGMLF